ncbi:hypothetical protein FGB62_405g05 [Gracilaria domingensis]|nr:hypothetical protein FGB62_405g05 [Gracilaria domingensis]
MDSVRKQWLYDLHVLEAKEPDFFAGLEARLEVKADLEPGQCFYAGLGATIENCLGLRRVYELYYLPRIRGRSGTAELTQTTLAISQFLRWAVSPTVIRKEDVWKEAALFKSVGSRELVLSFTDYFREHFSAGTTRIKATCLTRVRTAALLCVDDKSLRASLVVMSVILRKIASAAKRAHRIRCQARKSRKPRDLSGRIIRPTEYMYTVRRTQAFLNFLMKRFWRHGVDEAGVGRRETCDVDLFVESWCKNFTGFLMMVSGGQRPQAFSQLQVPLPHELRRMKRLRRGESFIELRTMREKRLRVPYYRCETHSSRRRQGLLQKSRTPASVEYWDWTGRQTRSDH